MNCTRRFFLALTFICFLSAGCTKDKDYAPTDYTVNLVTTRLWSGTAEGYSHKDTVVSGSHTSWPSFYTRTISDSSFAIQRVDDYSINILGATFQYKSTDANTRTNRFDTTLAGAVTSSVVYYYQKDSIVIEYHYVGALHEPTGITFYTNEYLHSN